MNKYIVVAVSTMLMLAGCMNAETAQQKLWKKDEKRWLDAQSKAYIAATDDFNRVDAKVKHLRMSADEKQNLRDQMNSKVKAEFKRVQQTDFRESYRSQYSNLPER